MRLLAIQSDFANGIQLGSPIMLLLNGSPFIKQEVLCILSA